MADYSTLVQQKIPYLYIAGSSFSGSTLLSFLLNTHPDMTTMGEAGPYEKVNVDKFPCSCGVLMVQCPFFATLEQHINHLGSAFSLGNWRTRFHLSPYRPLDILLARPLRSVFLEHVRDALVPYYPGYRQRIDEISQRVAHLAQAALMIQGKRVFVDALKDPMRIKFLKDMAALDLRVLHLVRDVRAGVTSLMKHQGKPNPAWATRRWCRVNLAVDHARRYVSAERWLQLRYTNLCADPQESIDLIADFMDVPRAPIPKNFYTAEHHIIGNRMRRQGEGIVREDLSWKERLTERDLRVIARIGGKVNRDFGYDFP